MPLFECSECHTVDNTALAEFWWQRDIEKRAPVCSACNPDQHEWHGKFPRTTLDEYNKLHPDAKPVEYTIANRYQEDRTND